jgi:hypothetical protein
MEVSGCPSSFVEGPPGLSTEERAPGEESQPPSKLAPCHPRGEKEVAEGSAEQAARLNGLLLGRSRCAAAALRAEAVARLKPF